VCVVLVVSICHLCAHACVPMCLCMHAAAHPQVVDSAGMSAARGPVEIVWNDVRLALVVHPEYANHVVTRHSCSGQLCVQCIRDLPGGQEITIAGSYGKQQAWLDGDERFPIIATVSDDMTIRARLAQTLAACARNLSEAGGDPRAASRRALQE
jgi:hypothetical protein